MSWLARYVVSLSIAIILVELLLVTSYTMLKSKFQAAGDKTVAQQKGAMYEHRDQIQTAMETPGLNLPPVGRALFDELMADQNGAGWRILFPFSELLRDLKTRVGCAHQDGTPSCYRAVLIPLGRSLQRTAAAPQFFKYPRVVIGFTGDSNHVSKHNIPLLKDRLYLAYQEKANLIEVISYNEQAGRFEFQLVKNYAAGQTPQIFYANRAVCVSCHQNQAPIFSRQVWDETNANPSIVQRLADEHRDFYSLPIKIGVDVPNAIDDATDRANVLAAYQTLWRDGCGPMIDMGRRCRAQALLAALQYRLTSERGFQQDSVQFAKEFIVPFELNWRALWPEGIKIPNNDLPNRDPLQSEDSEKLAYVPARFEALLPRGHKEIWQLDTDRYRLIKGIGEFFSNAEIEAIANKLSINVPSSNDQLTNATWNSHGFQTLREAVAQLAAVPVKQNIFDAPTIQHAILQDALFRRLGIVEANASPTGDHTIPPASVDEHPAETVARLPGEPALMTFHAYCGRCHATGERFPPNFLQGSKDEVQAKLRRCADRIYFRLSMWRLAAEQRPKTPMPPETMLPIINEHVATWQSGTALSGMLASVEPWLSTEMKVPPEQLIGRSYEQLRTCATN